MPNKAFKIARNLNRHGVKHPEILDALRAVKTHPCVVDEAAVAAIADAFAKADEALAASAAEVVTLKRMVMAFNTLPIRVIALGRLLVWIERLRKRTP